MSRYLVTGAAGFIGGALARRLASDGHEVLALDRAPELEACRLGEGIHPVPGPVEEPATYAAISSFGRVDAALHLAAQSSARISHERPFEDLDSNAKGTLALLEWCRQAGVRRVLYASSMAVYGNPERLPVNESSPLAPVSNYGVTKLAGEMFLQGYAQFGIEGTAFRLFNVYGPGQDMANLKQGMLSVYLAYILEGKEVPVTGSLERFRDLIHVDDVVDAWLLALERAETHGGVYNLGSGERTTVRQLLDALIAAEGHDPAAYPVREVEGHPGDIFGMQSDSSLYGEVTGWRPRVPLAEGIARMVRELRGGAR